MAHRHGASDLHLPRQGRSQARRGDPLKTAAVRPAEPRDADAVAAIYNHHVLKTIVTFEEEAVDGQEIRARMKEVEDGGYPWLVAEDGGTVLGYAYASKWKGRCAYRYSAETTIYLAESARGKGLGTRLYGALLDALRERKLHAAIGGIALPNEASVALHEKLGFRKVGQFVEVGRKFERWIDVGYWQALL